MNKTYLILLRGINVGGNNIIKMADLRAGIENSGYEDVRTYIQTGNVFVRTEKTKEQVESNIKRVLKKEFDYQLPILVLTKRELDSMIKNAPKDFGEEPKKFRYDVWFLISPLTPAKAMKEMELRDGVDTVTRGKKAFYTTRLISRASQSKLSKMTQKKVYQSMTIRNWNTTTKLGQMFKE